MSSKVNQEFEITHTLKERYYLDEYGDQRVKRTLEFQHATSQSAIVCSEDYTSMSKKGALYQLTEVMNELDRTTDKCTECRYRIGNYTGDPGYLLYIIFKTRIRLKFFELKYRLVKILTNK